MYKIRNIFLLIFAISQAACSQLPKNELLGSWALSSSYEFPDIIIFRSDYTYLVYNPNNADIGSEETTGQLKSNDIRIHGAYTSMIEKGIWTYDPSTKELILKERNILEEWSDFSDAYGKSDVLKFHLKQLDESKIKFCFKKQGGELCDFYEKNWSYLTNNGTKIFYQELIKNYVGTGSQEKEIYLSGYETELKISLDFYSKADLLKAIDENGEELFSTGMTGTNGIKEYDIVLSGQTKLIFKIISSKSSSKWKFTAKLY